MFFFIVFLFYSLKHTDIKKNKFLYSFDDKDLEKIEFSIEDREIDFFQCTFN